MFDYQMQPRLVKTVAERAQALLDKGALTALREVEKDLYTATVVDDYSKSTPTVRLEGGKVAFASCSCRTACENGDHLCVHAAALSLHLLSPEFAQKRRRAALLARGGQLLSMLGPAARREERLMLEVSLHLFSDHAALSLRAGFAGGRLYVVRSLADLTQRYFCKETLALGRSLQVDSEKYAFGKSAERVLTLVRETVLAQGEGDNPRQVRLTPTQLGRILRALMNENFVIHFNGVLVGERFGIIDAAPDARFVLRRTGDDYLLSGGCTAPVRLLGEGAEFAYCAGEIYRIPRKVRALFAKVAGGYEAVFTAQDISSGVSDVIPALAAFADVTIDPAIEANIVREKLDARVDLSLEGGQLCARPLFAYGDVRFDPLRPGGASGEKILLRDHEGETAILQLLIDYGFTARDGAYYISKEEEFYDFLKDGMGLLQKKATVYAAQELVRMKPRAIPLRGSLRVGVRGIEFAMELEGVSPDRTPEVLAALREKKKYVRLEDGAFLTLDAGEKWQELAREVMESGTFVDGHVEMEAYRTSYLNNMLDAFALPVCRDEQVRSMPLLWQDGVEVEPPIAGLRDYQKRGFNWMRQLYTAGLGGILADDMGLGKTVQTLSAIKYAKEKDGPQVSIVVAPTSLVYNWEKEIKKFAPELSVCVLEGNGDERAAQIEQAAQCDVLVASYAQIRRDIARVKEHKYRFCILDEAQYIKNYRSVGAVAAKQITARVRFALTGTPMENHIGELWSMFDFILSGYLGTHNDFINRFAEPERSEELAIKIRPFIMRRLKKDVLAELPDKIEDRVLVEMNGAQQKVYAALLARYKAEFTGGPLQNRMRVLAAITRLRQACCHPSLFLEGYEGGSGKLEALQEIVETSLQNGSKVLVFSQFTSMLAMIRESLEAVGIVPLYLDGAVPARERGAICERFNEGDAGVLLISLKAGGTGLNLTGADTVIHFDPWWNPAVEEQATDRAYRIGQTRKVHVVRLIVRGSIEEKVADLQAQKRRLVDAIIKPGEVLPSTLSDTEIMALFS